MVTSEEIEAQNWDEGCQSDSRRNAFVIPEVARLLSVEQPATVLDVGSGTGYVAREVNRLLEPKPLWTLVDLQAQRLALADRLRPSDMAQTTLVADITEFPLGTQYAAALATFTLLEIRDLMAFAGAVWSNLADGGLLIIALPDAWEDVLSEARTRPSALTEFMRGRTSLQKVDKFTNLPYPFEAVRLEGLIQCFLSLGFHLCEIISSAAESTFLLSFRRCTTERAP